MNFSLVIRLIVIICFGVGVQGADFFTPEVTTWKLLKGRAEASAPVSAWREFGFNDAAWQEAPAPIYYSTAATEPPFFSGGAFSGTRLNDMQNNYTCVFVRKTFTVPSVTNIAELTLTVACDDGFIAWINGYEVARYNVPDGELTFDAKAFDSPTEPVPFIDFPISKSGKFLIDGLNVLAVQGFNRAVESSDFGFMAGLSSTVPLPPLDDTKFDHDRGFYSSPFALAITCATPGTTIYYTLDGSSPSPTNGAAYSGPIPITGTTIVRARSEKSGFQPSNVDTHSYLFLDDVIHQSPDGTAAPGWPTEWGGNKVDYGMDPDIANRPPSSGQILDALRSLPSLSLVTDLPNLFDADSGIYANAEGQGRSWERPCSLELLLPDGSRGFQENARGADSRWIQPLERRSQALLALLLPLGLRRVQTPLSALRANRSSRAGSIRPAHIAGRLVGIRRRT